jgi:hypothetical protein
LRLRRLGRPLYSTMLKYNQVELSVSVYKKRD